MTDLIQVDCSLTYVWPYFQLHMSQKSHIQFNCITLSKQKIEVEKMMMMMMMMYKSLNEVTPVYLADNSVISTPIIIWKQIEKILSLFQSQSQLISISANFNLI